MDKEKIKTLAENAGFQIILGDISITDSADRQISVNDKVFKLADSVEHEVAGQYAVAAYRQKIYQKTNGFEATHYTYSELKVTESDDVLYTKEPLQAE